jgi:hypothetical protein
MHTHMLGFLLLVLREGAGPNHELVQATKHVVYVVQVLLALSRGCQCTSHVGRVWGGGAHEHTNTKVGASAGWFSQHTHTHRHTYSYTHQLVVDDTEVPNGVHTAVNVHYLRVRKTSNHLEDATRTGGKRWRHAPTQAYCPENDNKSAREHTAPIHPRTHHSTQLQCTYPRHYSTASPPPPPPPTHPRQRPHTQASTPRGDPHGTGHPPPRYATGRRCQALRRPRHPLPDQRYQ